MMTDQTPQDQPEPERPHTRLGILRMHLDIMLEHRAPDAAIAVARQMIAEEEALASAPHPSAPAADRAIAEIIAELDKATRKFPTWPTRGTDAAAIVAEECGELQQAVLQATYEGGSVEAVRKESIQAAAMAIQFFLNLPDLRFDRGEQVPKRALASSGAVPPSPITEKEKGDTRVDQKASSTDLADEIERLSDAWLKAGADWEHDPAGRVVHRHGQVLRDVLTRVRSDEAGRGVPPASPICAARKGLPDPPQDCDWPLCGCDPHAEKVIEALKEAGKLAQAVPPASGWQPIEIVKRAIVEWREMERIETGEAESNREREPRPANLSYHTACARRRVFKLCADRLQAALDAAPLPSSDPPPQRSKS